MGLFSFGRKKSEDNKSAGCCCSCNCSTKEQNTADTQCCGEEIIGICCVKVLGAGCKSCHELYENTKSAVEKLALDIRVEYITDMEVIMQYGVMSMPAIVVNDKVASMGKVLKASGVEKLLGQYLTEEE